MPYFKKRGLFRWAEKAQYATTTWFRARKELWEKFVALKFSEEDGFNRFHQKDGEDDVYDMFSSTFISIKNCLLCRNDQLTDDKLLALETAINAILTDCKEYRDSRKDEGYDWSAKEEEESEDEAEALVRSGKEHQGTLAHLPKRGDKKGFKHNAPPPLLGPPAPKTIIPAPKDTKPPPVVETEEEEGEEE
jgi:hypothetical protein